jgi:hypothetical protein
MVEKKKHLAKILKAGLSKYNEGKTAAGEAMGLAGDAFSEKIFGCSWNNRKHRLVYKAFGHCYRHYQGIS